LTTAPPADASAVAPPPVHPPSTWRVVLRLVGYARRRPGAVALVVAGLLLQALVVVVRPWPLKVLVDNVLGGQPLTGWARSAFDALPGSHGTKELLAVTVGATVVVYVVGWLSEVLSGWSGIIFGQRLTWDLASDLFDRLQRMTLASHGRRGTGDAIRRVTVDSTSASTIVQGALLPVATSIVSLVAIGYVMIRMDPWLTLLSLAVAPFLVLVIRTHSTPLIESSMRQQTAEAQMYGTVEQALTGIEVVQAFGREPALDQQFRMHADRALHAVSAATGVQLRLKVLADLVLAAGSAGILWLGGTQVLHHQLTVGTLLVFLAYLASLYAPLETMVYSSSTIQSAMASALRVLEVLDADPEVVDRPGAERLGRVAGHLRLEGVSFGYVPGRQVLTEVSLEAAPGETVAVVGPTGAGKSTLMGLVLRLHDPWSGRVVLDGRDLVDVELASLRANVALVLQESFLFPVSIAENISYGRPGADPEEIEAAARAANAHEFITALPEGYDTVVGDRGGTLSGGERQRIAIARAVLKDAPILILDEPTSALDVGTEAKVIEALSRLMEGRTTLIIAHRLSTVRHVDRVVVLDNGRIVEQGPPAVLLAAGGAYARLHELSGPGVTP
jgi:ATP-binding cassette subfamily B protein